jgi:hypothetical protein
MLIRAGVWRRFFRNKKVLCMGLSPKHIAKQTSRRPEGHLASGREKMTINQPGDAYEQEADAMAERVERMQAAGSKTMSGGDKPPPSRGVIADSIRRKDAGDAGSPGLAAGAASPALAGDAGSPLPQATRNFMEGAFSTDFSRVRVHTDAHAGEMSKAIGARAFTTGNDIYFNNGQYAPDTMAGKVLLAHELTHTLQQQSIPAGGRRQIQRQVAGGNISVDGKQYSMSITSVTFYFDQQPTVKTAEDAIHYVGLDEKIIKESKIESKDGGWAFSHPVYGVIATAKPRVTLTGYSLTIVILYSGKPGGDPLTPEQERRSTALGALLGTTKENSEEELRLYEQVKDKLDTAGPHKDNEKDNQDGALRFLRFLAKNKDKIEGIIKTGGGGKLSEDKIQKIIDEYGKYIGSQPEETKEPETVEEFDKLFDYDPNYQKLSKADKQLLIDYAKLTPEEIRSEKLDFSRITTDMKVEMALKLSTSWAGEVADAAVAAFTDPAFVVTLIVTIGIYIGLWLTPDPTWVTKLAAGTLTVVMLTQFALEDIVGTAMAWAELEDECRKATTVQDLTASGNRFSKKVGAVGFDILLFIAMWGLGKVAGPKLSKIGARRGVARAEANLKSVEARPGSDTPQPAKPATAKLLDQSARPTASATLDALSDALTDPAAKKGLSELRSRLIKDDMGVLRALKSVVAKGLDIVRFLQDKAVSEGEQAKVNTDLLNARAKLARAQLIEAETIKDPELRRSVREERIAKAVELLKGLLEKMGIMDDAKVKKAAGNRDLHGLISALGEAIQRTQLAAKYPAAKGFKTLSNLAVVQELPGIRTIEQWKAAERARIKAADPKIDAAEVDKQVSKRSAGLYEKNGQVYKGVGEVDTLVTQPGEGGKIRPVDIDEAKTGANDTRSAAFEQTQKSLKGLQSLASGDKSIRLFDRVGQNELGAERTADFDLSKPGEIKTTTRGPEGKGFDESLGYDVEVLQELAKGLLKNLPPAAPQTIPPITSPKEKEKEK